MTGIMKRVLGALGTVAVTGLSECELTAVDQVFAAVVTGVVTRTDATPVPGTTLQAGLTEGACQSPPFLDGLAVTGSDGRFDLATGKFASEEFTGCVEIRVTPPTNSGLAPDTVLVTGVRFASPASDTVEVNVVLSFVMNQ